MVNWPNLNFLGITFQMLRFVFLALKSSPRQLMATLYKLLMQSMLSLTMAITLVHNSVHKAISR